MKKKIVGIFICMLFICSISSINAMNVNNKKNNNKDLSLNKIIINDKSIFFKKNIFYPTDDTFISHRNISANNGLETKLKIRNEYGAGYSPGWADNSLIKFDISSIPSNSKIISAKLELYYCDNWDFPPTSRELNLYRINKDWKENTVTWENQPDYSRYSSASAKVPLSTGNWITWDVTNDVNGFIKGSINNYGWKITDDTLWGYPDIPITYFYSKEYGAFSPKLNIIISNSKDKPNNQNYFIILYAGGGLTLLCNNSQFSKLLGKYLHTN